MIEVSILGGSGYAGGELLRILLGHPEVRVKQVTSRSLAGQAIELAHPNLRRLSRLSFCHPDQLEPTEVLFVALPNGESMLLMERLITLAGRIIDCGADFRLKSAEDWEQWYKKPHACPQLLPDFVYGLPETQRPALRTARWAAVPGCEATVSILSLWPLVKSRVIESAPIIIDAKMSSSQAGAQAGAAGHHPERSGGVRSYQPTGHRHTVEIEQELNRQGSDTRVAISATAVDLVRGVLVTIHTYLRENLQEKDVRQIYRQAYESEPFVRIIKERRGLYRYPEPKILQGTNMCEIGFERDNLSQRLVVIGAIDNLVKGTAGGAVQCMNLMCGFEESTGLGFAGLHPI